jgi:single-strand DNA-binding protein
MAGSLNKVMLIGRLTRDPELRFTPSGTAVCNLALATNRYGQDASGERREFTDYHDIVVWNIGTRKLAETCGQYLQKGRMVYIEGRLQTRSWDDKDTGAKRYKTEVNANDVQFLDSRQDGEGSRGGELTGQPAGAGAAAATPALGTGGGGDVDPDDIPF